MYIKKSSIKIATVLTIGVSTFLFTNNINVKDTVPKEDIVETLALMNITETMISMNKNIESELYIDDNSQEEIREKEVAINETHEKNITTFNEEGTKDTNENTNQSSENKRPTDIPSRGESIDSEKNLETSSKSLNQYVLDVISTYSLKDGAYPYLLNNDFKNYNGVTEDIYYNGQLILKANPAGDKASNCTGITFEVFFKAMQKRNKELGIPVDDFNGMSKDELFDMALTWFVANGSKSQSNLAVALEKYGLGTRINDLEKVRPGDFIDLSRENNSGHTAIFINWIREGEKIIGLKFWSSQGSTDGISYKEEYFNIRDKNGNKYGGVRMDNLHIARVSPVSEYR